MGKTMLELLLASSDESEENEIQNLYESPQSSVSGHGVTTPDILRDSDPQGLQQGAPPELAADGDRAGLIAESPTAPSAQVGQQGAFGGHDEQDWHGADNTEFSVAEPPSRILSTSTAPSAQIPEPTTPNPVENRFSSLSFRTDRDFQSNLDVLRETATSSKTTQFPQVTVNRASSSSSSSSHTFNPTNSPLKFQMKTITFQGRELGILLQQSEGPCGLLALSNALLLRGSIRLPIRHRVSFI